MLEIFASLTVMLGLVNTFSSATLKGYLVKFLEKICRMVVEKLNKCKMILLFKYCQFASVFFMFTVLKLLFHTEVVLVHK